MTTLEASPMHWTTRIGVAAVLLFMLVVIALNAIGWITTLPGAAGIAACVVAIAFELMALVLWEHFVAFRKAKDTFRAFLAGVGLVLAVLINLEGGHRGINVAAGALHQQAEQERISSQEVLDDRRARLQRQIADHQRRIDGLAATNPGETYPGRMEQWRLNFQALTADDRRQVEHLRSRLDQMPLTVERREPYPTWAPYAIAAVFVFFSVFGLTLFGVKVPGRELSFAVPRKRPSRSRNSGTVIDLGTVRDMRDADERDAQTVRRLKALDYSFRRIEGETGISKSRAQRLLAAK